jgi:hypothetical protein
MQGIISNLIKYLRFFGGSHVCNVCNRRVRSFFPFSSDLQQAATSAGFPYDFRRMETLNFDDCNCPFCLSSDRERLYMLYLSNFFKNYPIQYLMLDFAPSKAFSQAIRKFELVSYSSVDYYRSDVDLKLDICNMIGVQSGTYDIVICSHILEHVTDPDKGLAELYRILKPGGFVIVMVPLFWDVDQTMENPAYDSDELRLKYFGQKDHVRLFSKQDFTNRISNAKFDVKALDISWFDLKDVRKYAIADNSILYVCSKS